MSFFGFRLDEINVKFPRGKIPDDDIVTFSLFVNQIGRGHAAGRFSDLDPGSVVPAEAVQPSQVSSKALQDAPVLKWILGPIEVLASDVVTIVYTGHNISDSQLDLSEDPEIELKILDTITTATVGAIGGAVASAVGAGLGLLGDPIGKLIGYHRDGPCNGLVFSDTLTFTGESLDALPYNDHGWRPGLPFSKEAAFTRSYTDEQTHDKDVCGQIAETDVTFSVLQVPSISLESYGKWMLGDLRGGIRQYGTPGMDISIRSLLHLRV